MKRIYIVVLSLAGLLLAAGAARADQPGRHPAYLHALEDLRHARAHLERPGPARPQVRWDENIAIRGIDDAIREIKEAAIDDGKDLRDHPPVDAALDWPGRLRRSLELLRKARADVSEEEDNNFARGLKRRAIERIDTAIRFVEQGIANEGGGERAGGGEQPGRHPAYLHALEDLRHARAHLERPGPARAQVRWDENVAIRKIDDAIREIKGASIDDGKDLRDHPPVDAALDWPGRLRRSLELLRKARADVNEEEDNDFARGLKRRAVEHIDQAIRFVEQGIANERG
jgi:hypothetical protein